MQCYSVMFQQSVGSHFELNIQNIDDYSSKIYDLRPVSFNYIESLSKNKNFGLIAEEVSTVMPELIVNDKDGNPYTVKYQDLPIMLLKSALREKNW